MGGDVASPIWLSDPKQTCSIDNVYIALTQCFAVIICGYEFLIAFCMGTTNIILDMH